MQHSIKKQKKQIQLFKKWQVKKQNNFSRILDLFKWNNPLDTLKTSKININFSLFFHIPINIVLYVLCLFNRIYNGRLGIIKTRKKDWPQTNSSGLMDRTLRPSRFTGWAQIAVTDCWNWLSVNQGPSHCMWQSHSRLLVFRTLRIEE